MPELPEVEYARSRLARWVRGAVIEAAHSFDELVVPDRAAFESLRGSRVVEVTRRGKNVVVELEDADGTERALWFHLGMSGHLEELPRSTALELGSLPRFTRWVIATGAALVALRDGRRLGRAAAGLRGAIVDKHLKKLGPEATEVTSEMLERVLDTKKEVKVALMDQGRLAGLGNIHAAEALFLAKIHPERPARSIDAEERVRLATAIRAALARAMIPDTADLAYVNEGGENIFFVYGHKDEPCSVCGTPIARKELDGRSTYFCPGCQPRGRSTTRKKPVKRPAAKKAPGKRARSSPGGAKKESRSAKKRRSTTGPTKRPAAKSAIATKRTPAKRAPKRSPAKR
jgi:formamidopyrimidine-DNA glycosylase